MKDPKLGQNKDGAVGGLCRLAGEFLCFDPVLVRPFSKDAWQQQSNLRCEYGEE